MSPDLPAKETLPHLVRRALAEPRADVLVERVGGAWTPTSSSRLLERSENVACAIRDAGLSAGDRVALVAHDCIDWIVCDFGTLFAGCVVVPIYPTQALDHTAYILQHSGAKLVFADSPATLDHLRQSGATLPRVVIFDSAATDGLAAFEARGAQVRTERPDLPGAYEVAIQPDDLAVLIYTSGTTGNPKGVMLSHDNLTFNAQAALLQGLEAIEPGQDVLSVLPYSHIYEHTIIYIYLLAGVRYNICHDPNSLLADLRDVRPFGMTSVPRIFDRVLAGITGQALKDGGLKAKLVPWALHAGRDYMTAKTFGRGPNPILSMKYAIAKAMVMKKMRAMLGLDRMRFFTSGSAALHVDTAMTFLGIGIPIMQGYGLTETSPVITTSRLTHNEYGAVGQPIPGVEVQIAQDGEILTRGRHVMKGYYNEPEATSAAIDSEGWFHTGDIGELDANGYLRITDRKKEVFKTDTGKWISPARIESAIKRSVLVGQAMVVGNSRPYPTALIAPNWDIVRIEMGLPAELKPSEMVVRDDVRDFLTAEVRKQTADLATYEQIRRIIVLPREFSVEGGELSPSMKIKRRVVEDLYAAEIDRAYGADTRVASHA
ncbi:MAG: long-chain fatty acid--CoA ligase [Candidatus Eremiobacteraeota bacterium]|nr:long-chain fatty acid--CoA ligase [Candidatus Eremiobacteraeota bacterium]